jgi:hypothetical protein
MNKILLLTLTLLLTIGFFSSAFANGCEYSLDLGCPPPNEGQSFINGLDVQINGGTGAGESCPPVDWINFEWGDGSNNNAWFPASHTYAATGDYTLIAKSFYSGNEVASSSCVLSINCVTNADCDDGLFCTANDECIAGTCAAVSACPPSIDGCVYRNDSCDEINDQCVDFLDDNLCAESEMCVASGDCVPIFDCVGFHTPFDEPMVAKKKSKKALPLKFNLFDYYGAEIDSLSPPPMVEVRVTGNTGSDISGYDGELLPAGLSDDGNEFRYDLESGHWILNLGMKAYTASATYMISVIAGDSSYAIDGCTESFTRQ